MANDHAISENIAEKLFEYALENNMLITDANTAFEQLGIQEYADEAYNRITVEWDTKNHTITVIKEGLNDKVITLGQMK